MKVGRRDPELVRLWRQHQKAAKDLESEERLFEERLREELSMGGAPGSRKWRMARLIDRLVELDHLIHVRIMLLLGKVEYEERNGRFLLVLYRDTEFSPTDPCPFCGYRHHHDPTDGFQHPQCVGPTGPIEPSCGVLLDPRHGYVVRTRTPLLRGHKRGQQSPQ